MENTENKNLCDAMFKCEWSDCGKVFNCKNWLWRHQKTHLGIKHYHCCFLGCNKRFTHKIQLKNHLFSHQKESNSVINIRNRNETQLKTVTQVVYVGIMIVNSSTLEISETNLRHSLDEKAIKILIEDKFLIKKEFLSLSQNQDGILGSGNFGSVYKGLFDNSYEKQEVAIKILKNVCDEMSVESFIREGIMLKDFKHERVLTPMGISIDEYNLPMIVLPFMANGDLLTYLRNDKNSINVAKMLTFVQQIAEGMIYLSDQRFVHRDLAARNCLLDSQLCVKIGDFGLSRDIYEKDYYRSFNKKPMPVKWMAPESIETDFFNTKTDIWSFGVLVWEIFKRGVNPYPGIENLDVLRHLKEGKRLKRPRNCPQPLYDMLLKCWSNESKLRPDFKNIIQKIEIIINNVDQYVNIDEKKIKAWKSWKV